MMSIIDMNTETTKLKHFQPVIELVASRKWAEAMNRCDTLESLLVRTIDLISNATRTLAMAMA